MSRKKQIILGISAYYHDAAAAIIVNGEIIAAAEEERFTRVKHSADFPIYAIQFCLQKAGVTLSEVDQIIFYDKPLLKFERILEIAYENVPNGFQLFSKAVPQWLKTKLNLRKTIQTELKQLDSQHKFKRTNILFTSHHMSHAASAFYPSPFEEAAILIIDGVGEWATVSIGNGSKNGIELIEQINFPHSVGMLYSAFTEFLGFKVNNGEYKLMGLSPYGNADSERVNGFYQTIKEQLITIHPDGSFQLNTVFFAFNRKERMTQTKKWEHLFQMKARKSSEPFLQEHADLALAIQNITEELVLGLAKRAIEKAGSKNLVMAGGVALNGVVNGQLVRQNFIDEIWIQPAAGDAGGALGAALIGADLLSKDCLGAGFRSSFNQAFLGRELSMEKIFKRLRESDLEFEQLEEEELIERVAAAIINEELVGWVQGAEEFGPRALGARSIIASPLKKSIQQRINKEVKFREDFRPFAPAMLKAEAIRLYGFHHHAPYMQFVTKIKPSFRYDLPPDFHQKTISERVKIPVAVLEAVTHVDFSSRLQVVEDKGHPFFRLLKVLKSKTGYGVVLNTSFNRAGEPIVSSISDIFDCFEKTALDLLVINNLMIRKKK